MLNYSCAHRKAAHIGLPLPPELATELHEDMIIAVLCEVVRHVDEIALDRFRVECLGLFVVLLSAKLLLAQVRVERDGFHGVDLDLTTANAHVGGLIQVEPVTHLGRKEG